jgi:hypothetical protein
MKSETGLLPPAAADRGSRQSMSIRRDPRKWSSPDTISLTQRAQSL